MCASQLLVSAFIVIIPRNIYHSVSYPAGVIFTFFVIVMLKQLVREVKSGVRKSSVVTSRWENGTIWNIFNS